MEMNFQEYLFALSDGKSDGKYQLSDASIFHPIFQSGK